MWVVVGASAGLGRALSERLSGRGRSLLLVAGDERDLAPLAADLQLTRGGTVRTLAHDAADHEGLARRLQEAVGEEALDGVLFPIGWSRDDDTGALTPAEAERVVQVNFLSVVSVATGLLPLMVRQGRGVLVGFGSVAATRGRSRNVVYAASKRALESYFESLRHLAEPHGVTVAFYRLGFIDTALAYGKPVALPKADPRHMAARICADLGRRAGARALPQWWAPVTAVLRFLPWFVFRRLRF
jgi:short-subunit dehydrogenase